MNNPCAHTCDGKAGHIRRGMASLEVGTGSYNTAYSKSLGLDWSCVRRASDSLISSGVTVVRARGTCCMIERGSITTDGWA